VELGWVQLGKINEADYINRTLRRDKDNGKHKNVKKPYVRFPRIYLILDCPDTVRAAEGW